jgi:hypothetical protein
MGFKSLPVLSVSTTNPPDKIPLTKTLTKSLPTKSLWTKPPDKVSPDNKY